MENKPPFKYSYFKSERTGGISRDTCMLKTVPDYLKSHSKNQPDKGAIVFADTDGSRECVTFKDWYENAVHVAKCLLQLGVKNSEFVAVSMRSSSKWLYSVFGASIAGARPISVSFTYTDGSDVIAMMKKLQTCSLIILDLGENEANWNIFRAIIQHADKNGNVRSKHMPYLRYLICHERPSDNSDVLILKDVLSWETPEVDLPEINHDDIFTLFQTSGSTGVPKPVAHTHKSFIGIAKNWSKAIRMEKDGDILYNDRPFPWIGGFPLVFITGHTRVTLSGYCQPPDDKVGHVIDVIKRERCSSTFLLPRSLYNLICRQDDIGDDWPLETVLSGGQPITTPFVRCIDKVCKTFICGYGATEYTPCSLLAVRKPEDFHEYTIGYPFEGLEMKIVDEEQQVVPVYQRGNIYLKSDYLFKEYYNDPEKTRAVMTDDGWYKTDDIGFMTQEGLFYCEGRKSEMIISGGMNVAPLILEAVIQTCPGVARAICVPVPDEILYQVICACVILEDGSNIKEDTIRSYCEGVHNDKQRMFTVLPTYYLIMDTFPETYTGKVSRPKLTKVANEMIRKN